ncbi:hypothetical protein [Consotaella aegiceratis]|uniref:hypothetical protein n=1 Tax=Consotaella aegiceratis TaxID=3097961 RepID=UPI002F4136F6
MRASPVEAMKAEKRSAETFFDWFGRVTNTDVLLGDPEEHRKFFASRDAKWFDELSEAYDAHHRDFPGGFSLPPLRGRRPLLWDQMETAGDARMGGIDRKIPFFGPLTYEGVIFTDGIALPAAINRHRTAQEAEGSPARQRFLAFMDVLIDYAPMFRTGQLAIVSESAAFSIAMPRDPHQHAWFCEEIDQDILGRMMREKIEDVRHQIPTLIGYHNLAAAFDADPVIADHHRSGASTLYDYIGLAAYAGEPEQAYSALPELDFSFHFDVSRKPNTLRERAEMLASMVQDDYWVEVRRCIAEAGNEKSRADYHGALLDGLAHINARDQKKPPMVVRASSDLVFNTGVNFAFVGAIGLAAYAGHTSFAEQVANSPIMSSLFGAAFATGAGLAVAGTAARMSRRPFTAADVFKMVRDSVADPSARFASDQERAQAQANSMWIRSIIERNRKARE